MTRFIDIEIISHIINKVGISIFIQNLTDLLTENFKRWPEFEKSARLASHSKIGVIELMPVSDHNLYGFKYVNGHPSNTARGMSTVMAFGALTEVETGYPLLLSELTISTALRTAATSVMAARVLARKDAKVMAIIGNGAQSEFQAIAFHSVLGINEIHIYDIDKLASEKLVSNLSPYKNLKVIQYSSTEEAVKGVDIITTVTADKKRATILTPEMVEPGMFINGLGGDCPGKTELHADILKNAEIFVEYEPQTRIEGDIQQLDSHHPVTELWKVLSAQQAGRQNQHQVTVFDSVGFALEDFSVLQYLYQLTGQLGLENYISLIPELENPKNLFSFINNQGKQSINSQSAA